ncbi:hypothetical protein PRUPE_1G476600 [Prunus persica]|uniref:Uncharacterized protein n=1 Tax=Prunus persica TaxID=3760 RepID=M5XQ01_PRUPE|nr:hypothetical protein PRUPE_1G476600 [Prunus persica]
MRRKKVEESSNEASFDIENQATSMENQLTNFRALSPACSIYRVPERLRNVKQKAYTPQVVSIGPLHHGSKNLEAMEDHKLRYLKEREVELRHYYEDTKKFNIAAFVNIILVDAAFVIELLLRNKSEEKFQEEKLPDDNAWIFKKPWVLQNILPDMLMLENQLPFFILEDLYNLTGAQTGEPSIIELSYRFFQQALRLENLENSPAFRKSFMPPDPKKPVQFVDFIRTLHLPDPTLKENVGLQSTPGMTKLHQAGVKFNVESSKNLFDIQFLKNTLEIPKIEIHDYTELTLRNLIAFEQCHCDVELLVDNGIVVNTLGDNSKVSIMINQGNYYFGDLAGKLNEYCEKTTNIWKANLRQKYFNTPWAAIILLILTAIQTVCSIISVIDQVLAAKVLVKYREGKVPGRCKETS